MRTWTQHTGAGWGNGCLVLPILLHRYLVKKKPGGVTFLTQIQVCCNFTLVLFWTSRKPLYFQNFPGGACPTDPLASHVLQRACDVGGPPTQGPLMVEIYCPPPPPSNSWTRACVRYTNTGTFSELW